MLMSSFIAVTSAIMVLRKRCLTSSIGTSNCLSGVEIDGVRFYGIAYNHPETLIPYDTDIVVTHEPPVMILDESVGIHWGNAPLRNRILEAKPRYHLFGHAHNGYGILKQDGIVFSNAALLDDMNRLVRKPRLFMF